MAAGGLMQIISLLSTREMAVELFDAYAPSLNVREIKLPQDKAARSKVLFDAMEEFVARNANEHRAIYKVLNTIATINTDNSNRQMILKYINSKPSLKKAFNDLDNVRIYDLKRSPIAAMAAFIAVMCKSKDSLTQEAAKRLWGNFMVQCSRVIQGNFKQIYITPPTKDAAGMSEGLEKFREELEKYIRKDNQQRDYFAFVVPNQTTSGYISYYVNTSPPERDVLKTQGDHAVIGRDENMTGFEVRHYYVYDRVWISETKVGDQRHILDLFIHHVLGAEEEHRKRKVCEHRLPYFRSKEQFENEFALPEDLAGTGAKAWVSELCIVVCERMTEIRLCAPGEDVYLPTTFSGMEDVSIYSQIDRQLKDNRFPCDLWTIKYAEITVKLHPFFRDEFTGLPIPSVDWALVKFPIKPKGCTPKPESRYKNDSLLKQDYIRLQKYWGLDGITQMQFNMLSERQRRDGCRVES